MQDIVRNDANEIIRAKTSQLGVTIARQQYGAGTGKQWSKRFYFSKMVNGELARFPLSPVAKDAEKTADRIAAFLMDPTKTILDAKRQFNPRALARPGNFSTVGDLLEFHRENRKILGISESTANGYRHCTLVVLRHVDAWRKGREFESWAGRRVDDELRRPWLERSLCEINERLALDYQRLMLPLDLEDEEEELTQKITCDTNLRGVRSVFSREAMKLYTRSDSLVLPDISGFLSVGLFNAKKYFVLPDVSVIRRLFFAAPALKQDDVNAYRAFLVCVQAGMRKSEAANFRMDWLREEDSPAIIIHEDGKFKPKHGHGRKVLLDGWVASEMRELAGDRKYYLDGTDTERTDDVFARLNQWLRKCGVDSTKPTHELRKLWFSQKSKRDGLDAAAEQGGHSDPKITTSFYSSSLMPDTVIPFWEEPTVAALAKMKSA
jgi:integrase